MKREFLLPICEKMRIIRSSCACTLSAAACELLDVTDSM